MDEGIVQRERWMPPAAVFRFVMDAIEQYDSVGAFPMKMDPYKCPEHWIPLIIVGTLEWVCVSGWWPWLYTGVFDTNEAYKWVFIYEDRYEMSPDHLVVYKDKPELNAYTERINMPGIEDRERSEILQFIWQDIFDRFEKGRPPQEFVEPVVWATLMWILSEFGRDWLGQDPIFSSIYTHGVGYLTKWDQKVLDPLKVRSTNRAIGCCAGCGEKLWCVMGFECDGAWNYVCNACILRLKEEGHAVDKWDKRIRAPKCGSETCLYVACPHNPKTKESIEQQMVEVGRRRVENYRAQIAGGQPGLLGGATANDIVEYFRR